MWNHFKRGHSPWVFKFNSLICISTFSRRHLCTSWTFSLPSHWIFSQDQRKSMSRRIITDLWLKAFIFSSSPRSRCLQEPVDSYFAPRNIQLRIIKPFSALEWVFRRFVSLFETRSVYKIVFTSFRSKNKVWHRIFRSFQLHKGPNTCSLNNCFLIIIIKAAKGIEKFAFSVGNHSFSTKTKELKSNHGV